MDERLISLNAAIDALNKRWGTCILGEAVIRDAEDTLKALPSAHQEYEHIPADDVALKSTSDVFKSPMWWFDVLKEIEKAGYVICRKIKQ